MRKIVLAMLLSLTTIILHAQAAFGDFNSIARNAMVIYTPDGHGFYHKSENVSLDKINDFVTNYAYNPKLQMLYVQTANSNCEILVNESFGEILKHNKTIPKMKGDDLKAAIDNVNKQLESKFQQYNIVRQQEITDSTARAKADSIEKAKKDSLRKIALEKEANEYRKCHAWNWVPVNKYTLHCSLCDYRIESEDSIMCVACKDDTLYCVSNEELALGVTYWKVHKIPAPLSLSLNDKFKYHIDVWRDSLSADLIGVTKDCERLNAAAYLSAVRELCSIAPYGYFNDFSWGSRYSISFNFSYTNLNEKTIKYINVFFVVKNDVGDVRKTGNFQGTGPVESFDTGSWSWDHSPYYVAGDATNMDITKAVITYMDGSKKILTKNMLMFK